MKAYEATLILRNTSVGASMRYELIVKFPRMSQQRMLPCKRRSGLYARLSCPGGRAEGVVAFARPVWHQDSPHGLIMLSFTKDAW